MNKKFAYFIRIFVYWIFLPYTLVWIVDIFIKPTSIFPWALALMIFGALWSIISSTYLILCGHGTPFSGKNSTKNLVTAGPYSMSRHPIYFGYMIYTLGISLLFNPYTLWVWAIGVIMMVFFGFIEDKKLSKKFPGHEKYRKDLPFLLPLKKWKVDPVTEPPFLYAFMFLIGKFIVPFFFDVRITGQEKIPDGPYIPIANHTSYADPLFVIDALNCYVRFPITEAHYNKTKWFFNLVGIFPIKRYTVDVSSMMKFVKTMKKGGIVGIFPEGERNWDNRHLDVQEGVIKLLKMSTNPILPIRIENAHVLWPRWAKKLHKGIIEVRIGDPVDPKDYQKAFDFIFEDTISGETTYPDYRGIERYLWQCPECKSIGSLRSHKKGFDCTKCHSRWSSPSIETVRNIHDEFKISEDIFPVFDEVLFEGKKVKATIFLDGVEIGDKKFPISSIQSVLPESNKDLYIYTGELFIISPINASPLMLKELMDFAFKSSQS